VREGFEALEAAGYHVRSAYTAVKNPERTRFIYTDRLWQGADMVGLGVASFGHINGVHIQNLDTWETYSEAVRRGDVPLSRAYRPTGWRALKPREERRLGRQRGPLRPLGSPAALVSRRSPAITAYAWPGFV